MSTVKMTVIEWADEVLLKEHDFDKCHIAITKSDGNGYDLEVEVDMGTIASVYFGAGTEPRCRKLVEELENYLTSKGKVVFRTRIQWEDSWEDDE